MSIFAKIRGAKKAADEHRKSIQVKERDVPKTPYRHVPTHAGTDALRIVQPNNEVLRDKIKEQHRRRSELGPTRSGSDILTSHAIYRRQNSATSLGDMSIASMLLQPPPANSLPPLKPIHPSKMNNYRYSGFSPSTRNRPGFTTSASATSIAKGKSPLSTMTSSINELPEECLQQADSPIESSKRSTKSLSSSSSEGLEMRYSTPGQSLAQTSAPHTRATSVASRADSPKSRKLLQTDIQPVDEPQRSKSPAHVVPSPIPESASPKVFEAELEAIKPYHTTPDRLADQRVSTPVSHVSTITPTANAATSKRPDDEWFPSYSSQHSTPTPRKTGKNFSRPTIKQEPNPPRLELPLEQDGHFERIELEIPPELISVGHVSTFVEIQSPELSQAHKTNVQSSYGTIRDTRIPQPIMSDRQLQQYGQSTQISQNVPVPSRTHNTSILPHAQTNLRQESYEIPYPQFSPRDTVSAQRTTHSNYRQGRISYQQPMQPRQQHHISSHSVQASHEQVHQYTDNFAPRQLQTDLEHERKQAYHQLSANDPFQRAQAEKQSYLAHGNSQFAYQQAPSIPMASQPTSQIKGPTIRPITYTDAVTPIVSRSQQLQTTSPIASPLITPTRSPMMSPARSPVTNPVWDHSGQVDFFGQGLSYAETTLSPKIETPQQPPSPPRNKKEDKRKSRTLLKRGKKASK